MPSGRNLLVGAVVLGLLGVLVWLVAPSPPSVPAPPAPADSDTPVDTPAETTRPRRRPPSLPAPPDRTPDTTPAATPTEELAAPALLVRVLAADSGEPIEGAEVAIVADGDAVAARHTDGRGELRVDDVAEGDVTVRARAAGRVRAEATVAAVAGELTDVELRLVRGVVLRGTVLDERTGEPIPGASVVVVRGGWRGSAFEMSFESPFGQALTDALGEFRIDGIEPGALVTARARAAGHALATLSLVLESEAPEPRSVELRLPAAAVLSGVVRHPDGRPAAGARVYAVPADAPPLLLANPDAVSSSDGRTIRALRGTAGDGGDYEVEGLEAGAVYSVLAVLDAFGRSEVQRRVSPTAAEPRPRVDLVVRPGATLTVRVTGPAGEPRTEGSLLLFGDGFPLTLEPGEPGVFLADVAAPGAYTLRVTCPGALIQEIAVEIGPGERKALEVRLESGLVLAGVLLDDLGEPVAGQTLVVDRHWQQAGELLPSSGRTVTDADGRFRVEGLRDGPHALLLVLARHLAPEDLRLEPPNEDLRITVVRYGGVRAGLVLPPGTPQPAEIRVGVGRAESGGWGESGHTLPWQGGALELPNVAPGACRIRIQVPGVSEAVREVTVEPGETTDLGRIVLERGLDLAGRVQDRSGQPIVGAEVAAGPLWTPSHRVNVTDREGRFALGGFSAGSSDLEVSAEGYLSTSVTVVLPLAVVPFVVTLDAGCTVSLRVATAEGAPAPGARVRVTPIADGEANPDDAEVEETDHHGALSFRLPEGRWRVELLDDEWEPLVARTLDLTEGSAVEVELTLPR